MRESLAELDREGEESHAARWRWLELLWLVDALRSDVVDWCKAEKLGADAPLPGLSSNSVSGSKGLNSSQGRVSPKEGGRSARRRLLGVWLFGTAAMIDAGAALEGVTNRDSASWNESDSAPSAVAALVESIPDPTAARREAEEDDAVLPCVDGDPAWLGTSELVEGSLRPTAASTAERSSSSDEMAVSRPLPLRLHCVSCCCVCAVALVTIDDVSSLFRYPPPCQHPLALTLLALEREQTRMQIKPLVAAEAPISL